MRKSPKTWLAATAVLLGTASATFGYDVKNPALPPVEFKDAHPQAPLKFVESGELKFAIIIDKNQERTRRYPNEKSILAAVDLLQEAFVNCTGRKPEVFDVTELDKAKKYPYQLLLGKSALTAALGMDGMKLPREGFEVKTFPDGVAIVGFDYYDKEKPLKDWNQTALRGTLWGAYDFVERFLGCRFYFPGEYGSLWPKIENLSIAAVDYTDYPRFATRGDNWWIYSSLGGPENHAKWEPLLGKYDGDGVTAFADRWRQATTTHHMGHNPDPVAYAKANPDKLGKIFYRAPNGNLYYNEKGGSLASYFDVTNLELADLFIASLKEFEKSNGKAKTGYSMNPEFINFGQCDSEIPLPDMINNPTVKKLNLITPENIKRGDSYSDIYGRFYQYYANRIKQEFPGRFLYLMPYANYTKAPLDPKWKLPDNVELRVCAYGFPARTRDPETAEYWKNLIKEWSVALGCRPVRSLWLYNVPGNPFARAIAPQFVGDIPKILGPYQGRTDMFLDQYGVLEWEYYCANYAAQHSMWNPDFNVDAAIDEHWVPFYGEKAGPYLKAFHKLLLDNYLKHFLKGKDNNPLYPPAEIDAMDELLKNAEKSLEPNSVEMKRFKVFSAPWAKAFEAQRNRQSYERPVYGVHQLLSDEKIKVDGKLDETAWAKTKPMPLRDPRGTGDPLKFPADFKLAWDKTGLYGGFNMPYPTLLEPQKSLWNNCNVELFIAPGVKKVNYFHMAIDALNQTHFGSKQFVPVDMPYNSDWKCPGFKSAVSATKDGWSLEFFIPYDAMKVEPPTVYDCWYANFVRNKKSSPEEYSSSSMTLGNNHNFEMYGLIKFLGKGE